MSADQIRVDIGKVEKSGVTSIGTAGNISVRTCHVGF